MKAIRMHTGELPGECQTTLVARILEFLDQYFPGVAEQSSLDEGEIKRHEFQPPAFFASAGSTIAKLALAQDIQPERLHRVLSSCKFIKKRARKVRKPKKPLGLFFFNMLF